MITSRPLDANDIDPLMEIVAQRPYTLNGYTDKEFQEQILDYVPTWVSNPLHYAVGMFENNNLAAAMIGLESVYSPSWVWAHWVSKPGFGFGSFASSNGIPAFKEADDILFDEMETRRNLNRFFLTYRQTNNSSLKSAGMSPRMFEIMRRYNFRVSRYQFITDCLVPAGQEPKYEYQKNIVGNRLWPMDIEIRMGVLVD